MATERRKRRRTRQSAGFSLIELLIVIIVIGILTSIAMQSMVSLVEDGRRLKTEREMEMIADAIVGNGAVTDSRTRVDFGYVGDVGAFPPDLEALLTNPGGYSTWDGPYVPAGLVQDTLGYHLDEWGAPYSYNGGTVLTSTGSGTTITKRIAEQTSDYLLNSLQVTVTDGTGSAPGPSYRDSVRVEITIPDGGGNMLTKAYHPDSAGSAQIDSLPVGRHDLSIIYLPEVDTLFREVTILTRHQSPVSYRFAEAYFAGGSP